MKPARVPRKHGRAGEAPARIARLLPGRGRAQRTQVSRAPAPHLPHPCCCTKAGSSAAFLASAGQELPSLPCTVPGTEVPQRTFAGVTAAGTGVWVQYGSHPQAAHSHTEGWRHTQCGTRIMGMTHTSPRSPSVIKVSLYACGSNE